LPLSLGYEGVNEILDLKLIEDMPYDEIVTKFNSVLPEGMKILRCETSTVKFGRLSAALYKVTGKWHKTDFDKFVLQETISATKTTKAKGEQIIDLKPHIKVIDSKDSEVIIQLPANGTFNINPSLVMKAFGVEEYNVTRFEILFDN